jgi:hypothetical protein
MPQCQQRGDTSRMYFSPERYQKGNLKIGETFSIDSHLGGTFTIECTGFDGDKPMFRATNEGWQQMTWCMTTAQASESVFIHGTPDVPEGKEVSNDSR